MKTKVICSLLFLLSFGHVSARPDVRVSKEQKKAAAELATLQKKLRKTPSDTQLRVRLATLLLSQENYDAALAQFDSALALQPNLTAAKFGRAEVKFLAGHWEEGARGYLDVLDAAETDQYVATIAERVGAPYAIRSITTTPGENMKARFSADGRSLVFQSNRDGNLEIYRSLPHGSQERRLTYDSAADESPCFSPDGMWIAFVRATSAAGREVYLMDALTGDDPVCVSRHRADDWHPTFSPKGDQLAFVSDRDDLKTTEITERQSDIFLFSLTDSSLARFTQGFGDKSAPSFTPEGAALVYVNNVNGAFDIFEQRLGTTQPISLIAKTESKGAPQISPNGKQIVYFEKRDNNLDLYLYDRDQRRTQRLTCDPSLDSFPAFSPDGNEIYFTSNRSGKYQIYAMHLQTPILRTELMTALQRLLAQQKLSLQ